MILTLGEVKNYLRIDDLEDDTFLNTLILVTEEYLKNATGQVFDNTNQLARLFCLVLISDFYENRQYNTEKVGEKARYTMQSILKQLQYCYIPDEVV